MLLDAATLTQIRADIAQMLPDVCTLLTATTTSDGTGGWSETWGTAVASSPCRLDYVRGREMVVAGALQPFSGWMFTLPWNTAITTNYRISHNGNTYAVIGEDADKSWIASVRAPAERV